MRWPSWNRLCGSAMVAASLPGQRRMPFLPRERLAAIRDRRIRQMVRHAARAVPFYRDWFASHRLDPRQIAGAADLEQLPILDKEQVRAQPARFRAEGRAADGGLAFLTSGTTGVPIEISHDRRSLLANLAYGERERAPVNHICDSGFRPKELYVGYETSTFKAVIAFYDRNLLFPVRPRRRFVSLLEPIERIAALVNDERPDLLVGYGGWIDLFFRTVAARRLDLHRPKLVVYMGEALPFGARDRIEGDFGIPVLSRYNAVESFKIGFCCQARQGFHLHEDLCHVRIVDRHGHEAPPGNVGQVVLSNLVNRATVLLNYPMGDLAAISPHPCPCGRTFRLLSELDGRAEDILALADGRAVHPRAVWQLFKHERDVLQYQLTQHEPPRFVLQVVTLDKEAWAAIQPRLLPTLRNLLGATAQIEVRWRPNIIREPGQKFRAVVARP